MKFWLKWVAGLALSLFAVSFLCLPYGFGSPKRKISRCLSNVKQQAVGILIYEGDFDDRYPRGDRWMDATKEYLKAEDARHCPLVPKGSYGYAFNSSLSLAKTPKDPEKVAIVYDSSNPIRNASDPVTSLPNPGRHDGKDHIAYADGHAKAVKVGKP
jgi:prepilin-type processing-associated H-X9-DG protein